MKALDAYRSVVEALKLHGCTHCAEALRNLLNAEPLQEDADLDREVARAMNVVVARAADENRIPKTGDVSRAVLALLDARLRGTR